MKPYGVFRILLKWIAFKWRAKGIHSAHSPFIFKLIRDCLKGPYSHHPDLETIRRSIRRDQTMLSYLDHGQGGQNVNRSVSQLARRSLKPRVFAELIAELARYFEVKDALELGTSLGLTTAYLSRNCSGTVYTMEGGEAVSSYAQVQWTQLGISNISPMVGAFEDLLSQLDPTQKFDLIFIDGHHQLNPTLSYFKRLMQHAHSGTLFIFDDIHWSPDMEKAWAQIQKTAGVTLCLDLFFIGLVFIRPELSRQTMELRY